MNVQPKEKSPTDLTVLPYRGDPLQGAGRISGALGRGKENRRTVNRA